MKFIIEKIAAIHFHEELKFDDAFRLFDHDKDGFVSKSEFINAIKYLKMNFSLFEIEELMRIADKDQSGQINFKGFSAKLMKRLLEIEKDTKLKIQDSLLVRIKEKLKSKDIDFVDLFKKFDPKKNGIISCTDLPKIFNLLNIRKVSKGEKEAFLMSGNVDPKVAMFNYHGFVKAFTETMINHTNHLLDKHHDLARKLYAIYQKKRISLFEGNQISNCSGFYH